MPQAQQYRKKRTKYEKPELIALLHDRRPLAGGRCHVGSRDLGACNTGNLAGTACGTGNGASPKCSHGNSGQESSLSGQSLDSQFISLQLHDTIAKPSDE